MDATATIDRHPRLELPRSVGVVVHAQRRGPGGPTVFPGKHPDIVVTLPPRHATGPGDRDVLPSGIGSSTDDGMLPRHAGEAKGAHVRDQIPGFFPGGAVVLAA